MSKKKNKRPGYLPQKGRPLRAKTAAKVRSIRITDDDRDLLHDQFGSLGNACRYIAEGIRDLVETKTGRRPA